MPSVPKTKDNVYDERRSEPRGQVITMSKSLDQVVVRFQDNSFETYDYDAFEDAWEHSLGGRWYFYNNIVPEPNWSSYVESSRECERMGKGFCLIKQGQKYLCVRVSLAKLKNKQIHFEARY